MTRTYGCWNTESRPGYWVRNTEIIPCSTQPPEEGWIWIEDTMSKDCRYDKKSSDARCEGCRK